MHHPALAMLLADVKEVGLRPEQQAAVDAIQTDLEKQADTLKEPRAQFSRDLADGVAAGKLDKSKLDADSKKVAEAAESTVKSVQDAANKLHATLDTTQRKKLVESMREKAERMQAHPMGPMHGSPGDRHAMGAAGSTPDSSKAAGSSADNATQAQNPSGRTGAAGASPKGANAPGTGPNSGGAHPGMNHDAHHPQSHGMGLPGAHAHMGIDRLSDILGLSQEQRESLRTKTETRMKSQMSAMKNVHAAMQKRVKSIADAFMSDKFDAKKAGVGEKHADMMRNMLKARVEFVETVLSILTPEQRTKFADHIRQHCEVCDEAE